MGRFDGKRALITGATSGIGLATAKLFIQEGFEVAVLAENPEAVAETVRDLISAGGKAIEVPVDMSKPDEVRHAIDRLEEQGFHLDVLINNAGIGLQADVLETHDEDIRLLFEVNYFAMVHLTREALKHMAERGKGAIINVSSCAARHGLPGMSTYASTKAAMHVFSQSLRLEARSMGVSVTELLPLSVRTSFFENARNRSSVGYEVSSIVTTPEHIAKMCLQSVIRPRAEMYTSSLARLSLVLDAISPWFFDTLVMRQRRKRFNSPVK